MKPKFRAWVKEDKEMCPVHAIVYDNETVWVEEPDDENPSGCLEFDDVILMQSTDIKDKSGKEIFEFDVVTTTRFLGDDGLNDKTYTGVVKRMEGAWVIDTGKEAIYLWSEIEETEVLGNMFENPNLVP